MEATHFDVFGLLWISKKMNKIKKKKNIKLPAIIGILLLVVGVGAGIFLVQSDTGFIPRATPELAPQSLVVTNITENSFSISWVTDQKAGGFLKYGTMANKINTIENDDRDQLTGSTGSYNTHHITIKGLEPETTYYFKIASGGKSQFYDNNGQPYEVTTAPILGTPPPPDSAYGDVITSASTPADGAMVYISLPGAARLSSLVTDGQWAISLSTARTASLQSYVEYDKKTTTYDVLIKNGAGESDMSEVNVTTGNDQPMATVTLGQDYDFTTQKESVDPNTDTEEELVDESKKDEVEAKTKSGFNLDPLGAVTEATEELTVLNPAVENEDLSSTKPEFMGTAPAGTTLTIEVHSDALYSDTVIVSENNTWSWVPPADLEPGDHTITVSFEDEKGILQTLTRSFVVYAADDNTNPAFTATPSATPKPTPIPATTPKPTPTPTPVSRVSLPSTSSGTLQPGSVENTYMILGLGLILMGLGGFIYSKEMISL
jgi:hypothetical protein